METSPSSQKNDPTESLNESLKNLFQSPTQGIEKAFSLILDQLKQQQSEYNDLRLSHDQLNVRYKTLAQTLEEQSKPNHETFTQVTSELKTLRYTVETLKIEKDDLVKDTDKVKKQHLNIHNQLCIIDEKVNTMAHNLELQAAAESDLNVHDQNEIEKDGYGGTAESAVNEVNDEHLLQCEKEKKADIQKTKEGEKLKRSRQGSVITQKLQHHETLAARLDRIESDKSILKKDIENMKLLIDSKSQEKVFSTIPNTSEDTIEAVQQRLITLEKFLAGFSGTTFDDIGISENLCNKVSIDAENKKIAGQPDIEKHDRNFESINTDFDSYNVVEEDPNLSTMRTVPRLETDSKHLHKLKDTMDVSPSRLDRIGQRNSFVKPQGLMKHLLDDKKYSERNLKALSARVKQIEEDIILIHETSNIEKSTEVAETDRAENVQNVILDDLGSKQLNINEQIHELKQALTELQRDVQTKLSSARSVYEGEDTETTKVASCIEERCMCIDKNVLDRLNDTIQKQVDLLQERKVDKADLSKVMEERRLQIIDIYSKALSIQESKLMNSMTKVEIDVNECKESINALESVFESKEDESEDITLDEKIKSVADAMEISLLETISSRLNCLKAMEDELEKIASGLAEKPDEEQINLMIANLEQAVSQRLGSDEKFQSILHHMKGELNRKMSRKEVLVLVKQMLNGAKEDVRRDGANSLMIGHQSYRCLGCNEIHPIGVRNKVAPRVNHNSMPQGRGLAPTAYPYCGSKGRLQQLRSRSQTDIVGFKRTSRRYGATANKKKDIRQLR